MLILCILQCVYWNLGHLGKYDNESDGRTEATDSNQWIELDN